MQPSLEETISFIQAAHAGQTDKSGKPYWQHLVSVMRRLGENATENEKRVALLHDVIEDTPYGAADLRRLGYADDVVTAVEMLSRPQGVGYLDWIRSIAASGNRVAIRVKIADNEDNSDPQRIAALPPDQRSIAERYHHSLRILRAAL